MSCKSVLASTTIWGALGSLVIGLSTIVGDVYIDKKDFTSNDLKTAVTLLVTVTITIIGRVNAKDSVYTPKILPGPNKEDLVDTGVRMVEGEVLSKLDSTLNRD